MNYNRIFSTMQLMICLFAFVGNTAFAQVFVTYKEYPKPSAILVKLPTYSKRAAIYEKAKNYKSEKQIKADAAGMQREFIKDFNTNFTFCKYYFYYDTMQQAISDKQFAGNLYDKNLNIITTSPIAQDDTTYQIAYFGYYISTFDNPEDPQTGKENTYYTGTQLQRLILTNYKQERIPDPVPNGTNYDDRYMDFRARQRWINTYKSKTFDIYYTPYAKILNYHLNNYYNRKNAK